jgi:hypothetical protein
MANPGLAPTTISPTDGAPTLIQPELTYTKSRDSERATVRSRGPFGDLLATYDALELGKIGRGLTGMRLKSATLTRCEGGLGVLEEVYGSDPSSASQTGRAEEIQTSWRFSTSPQDVSVYRYCGPSVGANANRRRIENWYSNYLASVAENDGGEGGVADVDFFRSLTSADQEIARKLLEGKESVMRHFPTIQKITDYRGGGALAFTGELDYAVDSIPDAPAWMLERAAAWLKVQEDVDESGDGHRTLTESWIGAAEFDEDFYGENRWEFGTI